MRDSGWIGGGNGERDTVWRDWVTDLGGIRGFFSVDVGSLGS